MLVHEYEMETLPLKTNVAYGFDLQAYFCVRHFLKGMYLTNKCLMYSM